MKCTLDSIRQRMQATVISGYGMFYKCRILVRDNKDELVYCSIVDWAIVQDIVDDFPPNWYDYYISVLDCDTEKKFIGTVLDYKTLLHKVDM